MNDPDNNELHDDQLSNLYQQSRVEEPPMALDSTILTQARKAVAKPEKKRVWNRIGWMMPLASVAVATLTVSLIIQTKQQHPEVITSELMMDVAPMQEQGIAQEEDEVPAPVKEELEKKVLSEPAVSHEPEFQAPAKAAKPVTAKRLMKLKGISKQRFRSASASVATEEMASDIAETEDIGAVQSRSGAKGELSIDDWLKQIRELIKDGKTEEARKSLEAFRKAHPHHQLPEDINSFLKKQKGQ